MDRREFLIGTGALVVAGVAGDAASEVPPTPKEIFGKIAAGTDIEYLSAQERSH